MRICVFDLDHTLIRSPLDLAAMAVDIRTFLHGVCTPLPDRPERYRVGELIAYARRQTPAIERSCWAIALDHERRALDAASLEPGAREAVAGARRAGYRTAVWTNNAREITLPVLERFGLTAELDLVVTRDEMRELKPDPDGWRVIAGHFGVAATGAAAAVMVGDSWVDGLAARAVDMPFIAYRTTPEELARWQLTPIAHLDDLAALPLMLSRTTGP